jgi:hypothetical protein
MFERLVDAAFEYAFPLYEFARTRHHAVEGLTNSRRHPPNTVQHERRLSDHASRWITTPNNDTLYSNAWLDLAAGPVRVRAGPMPAGRYWSLAFMDAFTNHFAVLGQRLNGTGPVDLWIVASDAQGPTPAGRTIQAQGRDAWLFVRCLVESTEDLPNTHAMQDSVEIQPQSGTPHAAARVTPTSSRDPRNFLAVANELLGRNPPPHIEQALLDGWETVGLRPGVLNAWELLDDEARAAWTARIGLAHEKLRQASATGRREIQGWFASAIDMGDFGTNYQLRASVALGGLGALPLTEAMYFVRFHDDHEQLLDGRQRYLLHVPTVGIPSDSFWSFTMYEPTADGQRFFVRNPIQRYSIGNRTRGVALNRDGSLDIALQYDEPSDALLRANWLPTPAGTFQISLRAYVPRADLREGRATMPSIVSQ